MSLLLGPNQISRHIGDNQLLSAAVQNPGNLQRPQKGDAVPQCEMGDKAECTNLLPAAINGQCPRGEVASTDSARCKANRLGWREGLRAPYRGLQGDLAALRTPWG